MDNESSLESQGECPHCGSSDAYTLYDDGHAHCFSCNETDQQAEGVEGSASSPPKNKKKAAGLIHDVDYRPLSSRNLSMETVKKWRYGVATYGGNKPCQVAAYYDKEGSLVAQKLRFPDKTFTVLGKLKSALLFGQQLWPSTRKKVVVVEGEIDAMSVSQMQSHKWPVVSVHNGAAGAKKSLQGQLEWLEGFDEVILMFDQDEVGQDAVEECVDLFKPGKCKIATLPLKDANEMLVAGRGKEIIDAVWNARSYRPDGVVDGSETWDLVKVPVSASVYSYPWPMLNEKTFGVRKGEITTLCGGTGSGKSLLTREIAGHLLAQGETIGYVALEENVRRSALGFMSMVANKPLHLPDTGVTEDELRTAYDLTLGTGRVFLYDSWGSMEGDTLLSRLRYLARGVDCGWLVLDHLSIVVSGSEEDNERRLIDNIMTGLRSLVEETGVGMLLVSHLRRPAGNIGHEDGLETHMSQIRATASNGQLSNMVISIERNKQADYGDKNLVTPPILNNRYS